MNLPPLGDDVLPRTFSFTYDTDTDSVNAVCDCGNIHLDYVKDGHPIRRAEATDDGTTRVVCNMCNLFAVFPEWDALTILGTVTVLAQEV